jgi:riboflavin biosynthesis pyrimidine reductase
MLKAGGRINGGMLRTGLVDELSLLIAPVADGRIGTPVLFDIDGGDVAPRRLTLATVEQRADDVVWAPIPRRVARDAYPRLRAERR